MSTAAMRQGIVKTIDSMFGNQKLIASHSQNMAYNGLIDDLEERLHDWEQAILAEARKPAPEHPLGRKVLAEDAAAYGHSDPSVEIDYSPFAEDDWRKAYPTVPEALPGTNSKDVTHSQARDMIKRYLNYGHSNHSGMGATLWVLLTWLQHHKIPYHLTAHPGEGYYIERIES